ncbi:MAG: hypothetical protein KDE14_16645, partial [Rhodobacteraceae bacterium]|nr:hypothetical protein [Paracoccaceae bacterium]
MQNDTLTGNSIDQTYQPSHDEAARQRIVSVMRNLAKTDMFRHVENRYHQNIEHDLKQSRAGRALDGHDIERAMRGTPEYRFYSAFRYNTQEMTYQAVLDPIERGAGTINDAARDVASRKPAGGSVTLDPKVEIPNYLKALDVHLVPGCFYTEYAPDDVIQGMILAEGGKVATGANP